jgi:4-phytase/acid phosphatase
MQGTGVSFTSKVATFLSLTLCLFAVPMQARDAPREDGQLKLVVALFRHGIRAPLKDFASCAHRHSGKPWPTLDQWRAIDDDDEKAQWGNLTVYGKSLATALGRHYAKHYGSFLGTGGSGVSLWADVDERTKQTALGLKDGFCGQSATCQVKVDGLFEATKDSVKDPLFHPFAAGCGKPDNDHLNRIVTAIQQGKPAWMDKHDHGFQMVQDTLNCNGEKISDECKDPPPYPTCISLLKDWQSRDTVGLGCGPDNCPDKPASGPIEWKGAFSYASGASEAFLLEYTNRMPMTQVGWGRIDASKLAGMLQLHELFFDKTDRESYIATIQGSNLLREILDDFERVAGGQLLGCPHGTRDSKFVGLVGHDTNLATVGSALNLRWRFDGPRWQGIPANDALPAGALILELRDRGRPGRPLYFVRIFYVTFTPQQMRDYKPSDEPVWLDVANPNCHGGSHCEILLTTFRFMATRPLDARFFSKCESGRQSCP